MLGAAFRAGPEVPLCLAPPSRRSCSGRKHPSTTFIIGSWGGASCPRPQALTPDSGGRLLFTLLTRPACLLARAEQSTQHTKPPPSAHRHPHSHARTGLPSY
eukprot:scaffold20758_cov28-Tisochrysis_lutea.AAC.3